MVEIPLKDGTDFKVPWRFQLELMESYYDVEQQLNDMRLWCLAQPHKRKTRSGVCRFIVGWLKREGRCKPRLPESVVRADTPITNEDRERNKQRINDLKAALKGAHGQI